MPVSIIVQIVTLPNRLLSYFLMLRGPAVYRPEKYYMRGPGPQWHAKHDRVGR